MPQKMFLMGLTNIWECENRTFFHMWQSSLLLHIPFFVALHCFIFFEWMGWFRWITKQKMRPTTTNNNITSSLIIRWPSCNTMLQYSRNAINVYMFFIIIAISFYWYGNCFTLHWIRLICISSILVRYKMFMMLMSSG